MDVSKKAKAAKIISIIVFSLTMSALATALISDIFILGKVIFGFILACFVSVITFFFAIILMVISIVLIFGAYLLESRGFWPGEWARNAYYDVMKDYHLTTEEISIVTIIRLVLIVVCLIAFVGSIVCIAMMKRAKKQNPEIKQKLTKSFGTLSLIFSILGLFAALGVVAILAIVS